MDSFHLPPWIGCESILAFLFLIGSGDQKKKKKKKKKKEEKKLKNFVRKVLESGMHYITS